MKRVKSRFLTSIAVMVLVVLSAGLVFSAMAGGAKTIEEEMKAAIKFAFTLEGTVGLMVFALWFTLYLSRLKKAINPGTEPSHKLVCGAAAALLALLAATGIIFIGGVSLEVMGCAALYAAVIGASAFGLAFYTEM